MGSLHLPTAAGISQVCKNDLQLRSQLSNDIVISVFAQLRFSETLEYCSMGALPILFGRGTGSMERKHIHTCAYTPRHIYMHTLPVTTATSRMITQPSVLPWQPAKHLLFSQFLSVKPTPSIFYGVLHKPITHAAPDPVALLERKTKVFLSLWVSQIINPH